MTAPARSIAATAPTISIRNYAIVTAAYWAFTLTDGALRMLVLLHFNQLGYTPVQLAFLFLLYEFFGIVTNLVGGWVASRTGLSQEEAQKRVDDVIAKAKEAEAKARQAADTARKAATYLSLFTAFSMLIGAFIAAVAGKIGGDHRDAVPSQV